MRIKIKTTATLTAMLFLASMLVLAFNVAPTSAAPKVYHTDDWVISDTIVLEADHIFTADKGIIIDADNKMLDLNGHKILGGGALGGIGRSGVGVKLEDVENVIITDTKGNGKISDFDNGVYLSNSRYNKIDSITLCDNRNGICLEDSDNNEIEYNTVYNNKFYGIAVKLSDNNEIEYNTVYNNRLGGISISGAGSDPPVYSEENEVEYNTIYNNRWGINIIFGRENDMRYNTVYNSEVGIYLHQTYENYVEYNTVHGNEWGIHLVFTDDSAINDNTVSKSEIGIRLGVDSEDNEIVDNTISHNLYGIYQYSSTVSDNTIEPNDFTANRFDHYIYEEIP